MFTFWNSKTGYRKVSEFEVPDVVPDAMGPRHRPISHRALVDTVHTEIAREICAPGKLELFLSPDDSQLLGAIELPGYLDTPDLPYMPTLFFWHGNRQQRALIVGAGGTVFVCENGMISAAFSVRRKHTTGLRLRDHVRSAVAQARILVNRQNQDVERMRAQPFYPHPRYNTMAGDAKLARLVGTGHLTGAAARAAYKDWHAIRYPEFNENTRWHWYNAVTQGVKLLRSPISQSRTLESAWNLATCSADL